MPQVAVVVINESTRVFDREYHYVIPENLLDQIKPGMHVLVPFGRANKIRDAFVMEVAEIDDIKRLKEITRLADSSPVLSVQMLKLASWMRKRYICTYADAIKCMLPSGTVAAGQSKVKQKIMKVAFLCMDRQEVLDLLEGGNLKKIQQVRVLEMLLDNEYISTAELMRFAGVSSSVLETLRKYGYIDYKEIEVLRDPYKEREIKSTLPLEPTDEQREVLAILTEEVNKQIFSEYLLHGITGSGKTEVYMQLISKVISTQRQAIMLVPEIALTPQMVERFKGRFGNDVAVLHSRLSLGERYDQWRLVRDGLIKVVVGARSAVFAPFEKLGIIIVDEEHEGSYKSEITPKYHATDIARIRCQNENALLLLGSATPSVDTYYKAEKGVIGLLNLQKRANNARLPSVEIVDMRNELSEGNRTIFSRRLREEIEKNILSSRQTMLFLNRRGHSSFVMCRSCGHALKCRNCNITLTYHSYDDRLICHYCGFTLRLPSECPWCKSSHIRHFGTGTQKVEEDIKKQFQIASVIRMDMDTTTYKNSHEDILKAFKEQNINIMVGTQMIAKGHDFPNVTLVGVLAADSMLNLDDFKASEKTFQLITQVAGRAGRGSEPGRVIIQTYNTEDFSILTACEHDFSAFYKQEIMIRKKLHYPPFSNIGVVVFSGEEDRAVFDEAKRISTRFKEVFFKEINLSKVQKQLDILGPGRCPLSKIKSRYRWRLIIKYEELQTLIDVMTKVSDEFYKNKKGKLIELSMDINPVNML